MKRTKRWHMNPFHRNEEGVGTAEYVSVVACVAIIAGGSLSKLGQNMDAAYGTSSNALAGSSEMLASEQVCSGGVCTRDGAACFVGGTPIDTAEGSKAIEAVALGRPRRARSSRATSLLRQTAASQKPRRRWHQSPTSSFFSQPQIARAEHLAGCGEQDVPFAPVDGEHRRAVAPAEVRLGRGSLDLMKRLAAIVPPPKRHTVRYFGLC
jgi:Flp pilus assembly pilin Flp